ncbi:inovirus-type Gp2 protein [Escherichia coli]
MRSPLNVIITSAFFFKQRRLLPPGDYERSDTLRGLITGARYSALGLELEDHRGLVHFPANGRYILGY